MKNAIIFVAATPFWLSPYDPPVLDLEVNHNFWQCHAPSFELAKVVENFACRFAEDLESRGSVEFGGHVCYGTDFSPVEHWYWYM